MIFTTYEIRNFREGHVPPTHLTTSIASFPLVMFRGYKPATFLVEEMFAKFEYFGVREVVLRGGVSANPNYIPVRYGGKCKTYIAGCKDVGGDDFYKAADIYYDWLVDFVSRYKHIIKAVEIINECFWKGDMQLLDSVPPAPLFYCPLFCSEPTILFTPTNLTLMQDKGLYPAFQLHKTWSNELPKTLPKLFAIGEDYCYNEEVKQAFYHSHA